MTRLADPAWLLDEVRDLHETIRRAVAERLARAARDGRQLASHPGGWGAGDISYALDEVADAPMADFVRRVGARRPLTLVAEGPGVLSAAPTGGPAGSVRSGGERPRLAAGVRLARDPARPDAGPADHERQASRATLPAASRLADGVRLADGARLADGVRLAPDAPLARDPIRTHGSGRPLPGIAGHRAASAPSRPARPPGSAAAEGLAVRALMDPIDGTRPLMHDMRPAWILTGLAADRGPATRLAQIEYALMTELPVSGAAVHHVLTARRGGGATLAVHDVVSGEERERRPLHVEAEIRADNGFLAFNRFLPVERPLVADVERRFLDRAVPALGLDPRLLYDDQYLCSAGQLVLLATGRYRMLADLRAWLGRCHGLATTAIKPYDMAACLVASEAGVPVLDAHGQPLDAPFDTETDLDLVAYGNEALRRHFAPHLEAAQAAHAAAARRRRR